MRRTATTSPTPSRLTCRPCPDQNATCPRPTPEPPATIAANRSQGRVPGPVAGSEERRQRSGAMRRHGTMTQSQHPATTNDAGIPIESDEHSLTVGPDGPVLLQDHYLIEQMANFNRERIPERQAHPKGGAFGHIKGLMRDDAGAFAQAIAHFERGPRPLALASAVEDAGSAHSAGTRVTR